MKSLTEIEDFEKSISQLNKLIIDFHELSKKKPDEPVKDFKLDLVNSILKKLNEILTDSDKPFNEFSVFLIEEIPSNSDVLLVLNQYHECARRFAIKNVDNDTYNNCWLVDGKSTSKLINISRLFGDDYG